MAPICRTVAPLLLSLLVLVAPPAYADGAHTETRPFLVGGHAPAASLPGGAVDGSRCDVECTFTLEGARFLFVDVRGSEGRPFPYRWQLTGCATEQEPAPGYGHRFVWASGCARLTVRPAVVEAYADPWTCTRAPLAHGTPLPAGGSVPVSTAPDDYAAVASCAPACVGADEAPACLPRPQGQVGGTVTVRR